jgi:hypothetical protein
MRKNLRERAVILLSSLTMTLAVTTPALAAPLGQTTEDVRSQWWLVVLAVVMVATVVQLIIEVGWNYLEWYLMNMRGWQPTDIKSPQYQQFKSGTSLLIGSVVGVLVANLTGMRLFEYFEPLLPTFVSDVPTAVDVLLTGLLIGALTKPVHDLFGLLSQTKEFVGMAAIHQRELASDALASGVLKLAQSEAQALVDVPGIGPARLPVPSEIAGEGEGEGDQSATQRYVDLLHNQTMM